MEHTRQATQQELQEARTRVRAIVPPYDPLGPFDPMAPFTPRPSPPDDLRDPDWPQIRINRDPVDRWLRTYRETLRAPLVPNCAHCDKRPRMEQPWRPWVPEFAVLCGSCRTGSIMLADHVRRRTGRSALAVIADLMDLLCLPSEPN